MDFVTIKVLCDPAITEVLIAELFEVGFDSFQELEDGFEASCAHKEFENLKVKQIFSAYPNITFSVKEQDKINWNEEWEKNYDPIVVEDQCIVRATFHKAQPSFPFEIIVTPKMSFGTGHHATTYQMLAYQMILKHQGKKVLDVGTGTGILAIMAAKLGAKSILATDIDEWCVENSEENFALNQVKNAEVRLSQIDLIAENDFDIIIANINKNVLTEQIPEYHKRLLKGGFLLLSGFYEEDVKELEKVCRPLGLQKVKVTSKDRWAMLALKKSA